MTTLTTSTLPTSSSTTSTSTISTTTDVLENPIERQWECILCRARCNCPCVRWTCVDTSCCLQHGRVRRLSLSTTPKLPDNEKTLKWRIM